MQSGLLLFSAFLIASCGLIYELIAGTVSSYLLGDSVTQFSRTIGVYLFAMGVGSYLSKFIIQQALKKFIELEIILALLGGFSAPLLFLSFAATDRYSYLLYLLLMIIGTLVGLEIPLLLRLLKDRMNFKDLVARVLSLDYIGGLVAAISFPVFLLRPEIGLIKASLIAGLLNVFVAFFAIYLFRAQIRLRVQLVQATAVFLLLFGALLYAKPIQGFLDHELHADPVVFSEQTPYQKIVMTSWHEYFSLFLNNNLQFNSFDEYRYHETIVHFPMQMLLDKKPAKAFYSVLVMGGGDGLAVRELHRYPQIQKIDLVDIDPAMTRLAREHIWLKTLNQNALNHSNVTVYNDDAFIFIQNPKRKYDLIIIDFPDPGNLSVGKLYSDIFFSRLHRALEKNGIAVTQSTSPFVARQSFWCIEHTVRASGWETLPYHIYVPSFGEWGFVAFSREKLESPKRLALQGQLRFLTYEIVSQMIHFPQDMSKVETEIQSLMSQSLVHYYEKEWTSAMR